MFRFPSPINDGEATHIVTRHVQHLSHDSIWNVVYAVHIKQSFQELSQNVLRNTKKQNIFSLQISKIAIANFYHTGQAR